MKRFSIIDAIPKPATANSAAVAATPTPTLPGLLIGHVLTGPRARSQAPHGWVPQTGRIDYPP